MACNLVKSSSEVQWNNDATSVKVNDELLGPKQSSLEKAIPREFSTTLLYVKSQHVLLVASL